MPFHIRSAVRRLLPTAALLGAASAAACTPAVGSHAEQTAAARELLPGVPDRPDLVTIVPFYEKPNETPLEQTKVVIPAAVDGRRGVFILDLGDEPTALNRTFLQPNATGGVDTVTDANRLPDHTPRLNYLMGSLHRWDRAHVTFRIGTLVSQFEDPALVQSLGDAGPRHPNVILGHLWGDFGWVFAPRLGNIGPAVLQPFETIVDYAHRRVVLIRLDSAGHRLVRVPAYTPRFTAPLVDVPFGRRLANLGIAVGPGNVLDTLATANNTQLRVIDTGAPGNGRTLGYGFLRQFGAFGINQRTHQFILYRTPPA